MNVDFDKNPQMLLDLLLESSEDLIIAFSQDFSILAINPLARRLFCSEHDLVNYNVKTLFEERQIKFPITTDIAKIHLGQGIAESGATIRHAQKIYVITWTLHSSSTRHDAVFLLRGRNVSVLRDMQDSMRDLNQIVQGLPGFVYWKNKESVYMGCNDNFAELMGLPREQIRGITDEQFEKMKRLPKGFAARLVQNDRDVMRSKQVSSFEDTHAQADDAEVVVLTNKRPLYDGAGNVVGILAVSMDITEQKCQQVELSCAKEKAENADMANKEKSDFLAKMGHDLKTPLSGIIGASENLMHKVKTAKERESAGHILASANSLLKFLNRLVDCARIDIKGIEKTNSPFIFRDLIDSVVLMLRPSFSHKQLNFSIDYDEKIPLGFIGPCNGIFRVMLNLLSNAIKFTDEGSVSLSAQLEKINNNIATIKLCVKDTGIGIPIDKQGEIFEDFARVSPGGKYHAQGFGLGLGIVKNIVTACGGQISVESKVHEGSLFTVSFPLEVARSGEKFDSTFDIDTFTSELSNMQVSEKANSAVRVLLIEDHGIVRSAMKSTLERFHYVVDLASSGKAAVSQFEPGKYTLVYTDIQLPGIQGPELIAKLRALEKNSGHRTYIIVMTAHIGDEISEVCYDRGADFVMAKPLRFNQAKLLHNKFINGEGIDLSKLVNNKARVSTRESIIDFKATASAMEITEGEVQILLDLLMEDIHEVRDSIENTQNTKQYDEMLRIVHKFHGGLHHVGVPSLQKTVACLEEALREEDNLNIDVLCVALYDEIEKLQAAYETLS